ncbi:MAG: RNase adapter RapZ [bacterium]
MSIEEYSESREVSPRVVIVSGLSGSGKSTAVRALEDMGFFCIDNLPVPLLPKVLELANSSKSSPAIRDFAFVVDTREREFLSQADATIEQMRQEGAKVEVVFLEADDEKLIQRYSETRRPHPMSPTGTVRDGILRERELLADLKEHADLLVDSTSQTVHSLKALIKEHFSSEKASTLTVTLLSFGFKHGLPPECDLVFDVRFLPNPYFVEGLREKTGLDTPVRDYVLAAPEAGGVLQLLRQVGDFMLPLYEREGKSYLTVGIGCTGGKHRSVAISEAVATRWRGRGWNIQVRHRDVER